MKIKLFIENTAQSIVTLENEYLLVNGLVIKKFPLARQVINLYNTNFDHCLTNHVIRIIKCFL